MAASATTRGRELGRGRSAVVREVVDASGRRRARKLFLGESLAKLVNIVITGAPNAYGWNADAAASAASRRRILAGLVELWFGDHVRLPQLDGLEWDEQARAFAITMELIDGRGAALRHSFSSDADDEVDDLRRGVMRPLQRHLIDAGFDGLVWQAGLGNPVASANFLLERGGDDPCWVWIDLESGVPALFPLSPVALLRYYLPASVRHRRPLFDDVDVAKLEAYIGRRHDELVERLGSARVEAMRAECNRLDASQRRWRRPGRLARSIEAERARGRITGEQAAWYLCRPVRWNGRLAGRALAGAQRRVASVTRRIAGWLRPAQLGRAAEAAWRFCTSGKWRKRYGRRLVLLRIASWRRRRQLSREQTRALATQLRREEAIEYITDFGIHLAIKVPIKVTEFLVLPGLATLGVISPAAALVGMASGGMIGRTLYTGGRLIQAACHGRELPWVALAVGVLPIVGNGAYPAQIIYTSTERGHDVARFILYDLFTAIGRRIPIWGGADTLTEHAFNRLPDRLFRVTRHAASGASRGPADLGVRPPVLH